MDELPRWRQLRANFDPFAQNALQPFANKVLRLISVLRPDF